VQADPQSDQQVPTGGPGHGRRQAHGAWEITEACAWSRFSFCHWDCRLSAPLTAPCRIGEWIGGPANTKSHSTLAPPTSTLSLRGDLSPLWRLFTVERGESVMQGLVALR
jgi:hypothetical protein